MEFVLIAIGIAGGIWLVATLLSAGAKGGQPTANSDTFKADEPKGWFWAASEKGNDTAVVGGTRITIFPDYTVWKFCLADEGSDAEPYFSESYASKEAARFEAVAMVEGRPSHYLTTRETRTQKLIDGLGDALAREADKLVALESSVGRAVSGHGAQASLPNLLKRLRSRRHIARRLWVDCHGDDKPKQTEEAARIMNRYEELVEAVQQLGGQRGDIV